MTEFYAFCGIIAAAVEDDLVVGDLTTQIAMYAALHVTACSQTEVWISAGQLRHILRSLAYQVVDLRCVGRIGVGRDSKYDQH